MIMHRHGRVGEGDALLPPARPRMAQNIGRTAAAALLHGHARAQIQQAEGIHPITAMCCTGKDVQHIITADRQQPEVKLTKMTF